MNAFGGDSRKIIIADNMHRLMAKHLMKCFDRIQFSNGFIESFYFGLSWSTSFKNTTKFESPSPIGSASDHEVSITSTK
nr:hypothetical protein [Gracilibacillus boraciitolerans]